MEAFMLGMGNMLRVKERDLHIPLSCIDPLTTIDFIFATQFLSPGLVRISGDNVPPLVQKPGGVVARKISDENHFYRFVEGWSDTENRGGYHQVVNP